MAKFLHRYDQVTEVKADGVTYTPRELAEFVADKVISTSSRAAGKTLRLLDPAVGDGELLIAMLRRLEQPVEVFGFEIDRRALDKTVARIRQEFPDVSTNLYHGDFLDHVLSDFSTGPSDAALQYDLIIANPPYVRTQVMGAKRAKLLATQFNLTGRVDLYHAFLLGMARVLCDDGTAGFIVSNRFMTTKAGTSVRAAMRSELCLTYVVDLGDTKLFDAAVLPAVLIAKGSASVARTPRFHSIYESKQLSVGRVPSPIKALEEEGVWEVPDGRRFEVVHGTLDDSGGKDDVWRLTSDAIRDWLNTVQANTWGTFRDIGKIRVGVKTCADKVFLPKLWEDDLELHRPLTTHHTAKRYRSPGMTRKILYPHESIEGRKTAVDLSLYPKSRAYLEKHREALEGRSYVLEAGRQWYEIWVPQNPEDWSKPKLNFRDISAKPMFWMDLDGTVVNGDCYWLTGNENMLWLALAVANSPFIERFYDLRFNNKLYAGRRRFITQYVEQFPLPDPNSEIGVKILDVTHKLFQALSIDSAHELETQLNNLIWKAFGLSVEKV